MIVRAYAKINLGLLIIRRRDDGYHDIETIFHRIALSDEIVLKKTSRGIVLTTDEPSIPTGGDNLCVKAAEAVVRATGFRDGIQMHLRKSIPAGAGLGGGSADAAAVLRALPAFLQAPVAEEDLFDMALGIGSDVPYFLNQGSAQGRGRGEILSYFDLDIPFWILLAVPSLRVPTAWAYRNFVLNPLLPLVDLRSLAVEGMSSPLQLVNRVRNDLEPVVFDSFPLIMRVKEIMYRTGADFSLMSGSGSSVFGFFRDGKQAEESADFFRRTCCVHLTPPSFNPFAAST